MIHDVRYTVYMIHEQHAYHGGLVAWRCCSPATTQCHPAGPSCRYNMCVIVVHRTSTHSHSAIAMRHNHDWYMAMCTGIVCSPPDRCLVVFELVELDIVAFTSQFVCVAKHNLLADCTHAAVISRPLALIDIRCAHGVYTITMRLALLCMFDTTYTCT